MEARAKQASLFTRRYFREYTKEYTISKDFEYTINIIRTFVHTAKQKEGFKFFLGLTKIKSPSFNSRTVSSKIN